MCTRTVRSFTNARYISAVHPQKLVNYWKCGFCSECIAEKRSEYQLRTFYHAKGCLSRGGFILFDTLTYRDESLKFFSHFYPAANGCAWNFPIFSRYDISSFFKELHTVLERLGYDVRGNMDHIVTSEYGSRPDCTHRPHYHVLFFVNFKIDPIILSYIIGETWCHGRTDGAWYKGARYVRYQRVFRSLNHDLLKVSNYVAKYVGKDLYLYGHLLRRVLRSFYEMNPNWTNDYEWRLKFRRMCNQVLPFHVQSDGYGMAAFDFHTVDEMAEDDSLVIPSSDKSVVRRISLPLFYRRKLFYQQRMIDGKLSWCLTEFGKKHKVSRFEKSVEYLARKIKSFDQHSDAENIARWHLLYNGVYKPSGMSYSGDELLFELSDDWRDNIQFYKDNGLVFYNYSNEDQKYSFGRHLTDKEKTGIPWFDRIHFDEPCRCWSVSEFESHPPGLDSYKNTEYSAFLDRFFSWLRVNGDSFDFLNFKKAKLVDHYKEIGILDEFSLN